MSYKSPLSPELAHQLGFRIDDTSIPWSEIELLGRAEKLTAIRIRKLVDEWLSHPRYDGLRDDIDADIGRQFGLKVDE